MEKTIYYLRRLNADNRWEYVAKDLKGFTADPDEALTFERIGDAMRTTMLVQYYTNERTQVFSCAVQC